MHSYLEACKYKAFTIFDLIWASALIKAGLSTVYTKVFLTDSQARSVASDFIMLKSTKMKQRIKRYLT